MTITYSDLIIRALTRERDRVAFVQDGRETTYAAAADIVGRIGRVLVERGLGHGQGVAVLSPPRPEAWFVMSATSLVGARVTALHPLGSLDDHTYMCDDAAIHTLVVDSSAGERASELRERAATVKNVFSLGPSPDAEDLMALAERADATSLRSDAVENDICWLVYTGGTTGRPKGVMATHRVLTSMALTALAEYELPREVRYLASSPITHAAGMHVVPTLLRGGTVHLHDKFDPEKYLRTIESERISLCFGVPSMVYALLDHPNSTAPTCRVSRRSSMPRRRWHRRGSRRGSSASGPSSRSTTRRPSALPRRSLRSASTTRRSPVACRRAASRSRPSAWSCSMRTAVRSPPASRARSASRDRARWMATGTSRS